MKNQIIPSLWFDNNAIDAFEFYSNIFPNTFVTKHSPIVVEGTILGVNFIGINGGPQFKPNNSISFMQVYESRDEINRIWKDLSLKGEIVMPLDTYPWSDYYGWVNDEYGISWQLYFGKLTDVNEQALVPTLMFCGVQQGNCAEAIAFYETIFKDLTNQGKLAYPESNVKGQIMHAQFIANGLTLVAMDSGIPQNFTFNEGVSFTILCKNQDEIDYYWNTITALGEESQCGWCKDPYGISWQIVPTGIGKLINSNPKAGDALFKMKKIIISELLNA